MIRCEPFDHAGRPNWLLVPQQAHARLAGQLARNWQFEPSLAADVRQQLFAAADHHDDGWPEWDAFPSLDAQGRPRNFNEMPVRMTLSIWPASIAAARAIGPLAGWLAAGHFAVLLERIAAAEHGPAERALIDAFRRQSRVDRAAWLSAWSAGEREGEAARALAALQAFDAMSLWLCGSRQPAPAVFQLSGQPPIRAKLAGDGRIGLTPWPLTVSGLGIVAPGKLAPVRRYRDRYDLADQIGQSYELCWRIEPA